MLKKASLLILGVVVLALTGCGDDVNTADDHQFAYMFEGNPGGGTEEEIKGIWKINNFAASDAQLEGRIEVGDDYVIVASRCEGYGIKMIVGKRVAADVEANRIELKETISEVDTKRKGNVMLRCPTPRILAGEYTVLLTGRNASVLNLADGIRMSATKVKDLN